MLTRFFLETMSKSIISMRLNYEMAIGIGEPSRRPIFYGHFKLIFHNFRVKVQSIVSIDVIAVLKWDQGEMDQVSIEALRPLTPSYRRLPQMIFPARLHGKKLIHWKRKFTRNNKMNLNYCRPSTTAKNVGQRWLHSIPAFNCRQALQSWSKKSKRNDQQWNVCCWCGSYITIQHQHQRTISTRASSQVCLVRLKSLQKPSH